MKKPNFDATISLEDDKKRKFNSDGKTVTSILLKLKFLDSNICKF